MSRLTEQVTGHCWAIVLPGVQDLVMVADAGQGRSMGASLMNCGRAPTMLMILIKFDDSGPSYWA